MAKKGKGSIKTFNKKQYRLHRTLEKKRDAQNMAKSFRRKGELVRVIPVFRIYRKKIRKKRK